MLAIVILETLGAGVGLYNLAKGIYLVYSDVAELKQQYRDYHRYKELQKIQFDPLTQSQYACFEGEFNVL